MENTTQEKPELLTVAEVARHLRVDSTTVRRWIKLGALESVSLPRGGKGTRQGYRIPRSTLEKMLGNNQ